VIGYNFEVVQHKTIYYYISFVRYIHIKK